MHLILKDISGPLPTSIYELVEGNNRVGKLQLRHSPSKSDAFPEGFENYIYYEIYPDFRKQGYGKKILELGLEEAKKIGLKEVVLTCTEENIASQKIMEANSGVFLDKQISSDGEMIRKYKIALTL
jgi:predicted acetyltransferase